MDVGGRHLSPAALLAEAAVAGVKFRRAFLDPLDESGDFIVSQELFDRVEVPCQFGFSKNGVDF